MKSRSFRRKGAPLSFADAEDEDEQDQDAIAPARLAADRKAKSKGSQKDKRGGAGKLSFHEAEETASLPRPSERRPTLQLNHDSYKQLNVGGGSNGAYATQAAASGERLLPLCTYLEPTHTELSLACTDRACYSCQLLHPFAT